MPWAHWTGLYWFSHSTTSTPTSLAAAIIAKAMFLVKGLALETGMVRMRLPAAQDLASNAGPGAENTGLTRCSAIIFLAASMPADAGVMAPSVAVAIAATAPIINVPFTGILP